MSNESDFIRCIVDAGSESPHMKSVKCFPKELRTKVSLYHMTSRDIVNISNFSSGIRVRDVKP